MILDCEKIVYADNFFKRFKGLMFKKDCDYIIAKFDKKGLFSIEVD